MDRRLDEMTVVAHVKMKDRC